MTGNTLCGSLALRVTFPVICHLPLWQVLTVLCRLYRVKVYPLIAEREAISRQLESHILFPSNKGALKLQRKKKTQISGIRKKVSEKWLDPTYFFFFLVIMAASKRFWKTNASYSIKFLNKKEYEPVTLILDFFPDTEYKIPIDTIQIILQQIQRKRLMKFCPGRSHM